MGAPPKAIEKRGTPEIAEGIRLARLATAIGLDDPTALWSGVPVGPFARRPRAPLLPPALLWRAGRGG
jgi:hypothetical protein